jgi:orotate phosphoribosyltransferase
VGALLEGHFRLTSGLHSSGYLQCALVLQHPVEAEACGAAIADRVRTLSPDVVLSPALGGIVIGQEVGRALGVRAIFAERQDGKLTLRRGFAIAPGEKVLVVEDVVTTGGSTQETIDVARAVGATVVAAAAIHRSQWRQSTNRRPVSRARDDYLTDLRTGAMPAVCRGQAGR